MGTAKKRMVRIRLLTFLYFASCLATAQTTNVVQVVTGNATVSSTADVVINTGTNTNLTLPISPATGRTLRIVNHGVGDLLLSDSLRVSNRTDYSGDYMLPDSERGFGYAYLDAIPASPNEFRPYISTNTILILWDGLRWLLLGY